jgi:alpha-beta hydrolase superfamily lysophospholipase
MVQAVTDHYLAAISHLQKKSAMIGHSFGGLIVRLRVLDGCRVVGPTGSQCDVSVGFKQLAPALPTAGKQPQPMNEDNGHQTRCVSAVDLRLLPIGEGVRFVLSGHVAAFSID